MARKWVLRIGFTILVLAVLYLVAYLWVSEVADSRLTAEFDRIRESGEPLTLEEMAPPPIPDVENAAIPLARAAALMENRTPEEREAIEQFVEEPFTADDQTSALVAGWIARNGPAFAQLEEAIRRPAFRADLDYSDGFSMMIPQIPQVKSAGQLFAVRALHRARQEDIEGALEDCLGGLRIAKLGSSDPMFMLSIVRNATERTALDGLEKILAGHQAPEGLRQRLLATLEEIDVRRSLHRASLGERCFGIAAYQSVFDEAMEETFRRCSEAGPGSWPTWLPVFDPVLALDEAYYLAFMAQALELVDRPFFETRDAWAALQDEVEDAPWYAIVSRTIIVAFPLVAKFAESHRARVDLAMIALGGKASGPDPFTGKPYEIVDGKVLRSPGPDPDDEVDDIVWRLPPARDD